jgi:beta-phosphoglucomutase family hydrolase
MFNKIHAVIFDLDGTIIDNMSFHAKAWVEISRRLGCEKPVEHFQRVTAGQKNIEILSALLSIAVEEQKLEKLSEEKESLYRQLYRPHMKLVAGAREFIIRLREAKIPCALATLSPKANREMALEAISIAHAFDYIVGAEHTKRGKPAPDIFFAAASLLKKEPSCCIAFEDAVNGVQSARCAGMTVVGVCTATPAADLIDAGAQWVIPDYRTLPQELERLLFASPTTAVPIVPAM